MTDVYDQQVQRLTERLEESLCPFEAVCDSRDQAEWKRARMATVGASEVAALLGCAPESWQSPYALWAQKRGLAEGPALDGVEGVFWGHELEAAIVTGYAKRTLRYTMPFGLLLRSRRWPWLSATPDAIVTDSPEHAARAPLISRTLGHIRAAMKKGADTSKLHVELVQRMSGWWPLQIKNVGAHKAHDWTGGVPDYYVAQCVQEALVFGTRRTTAAALIAGQKLVWDDIEANEADALVRRIVHLARRFMQEHVEPGIEPRIDGSESTRRALHDIYPSSTERTVSLGHEALSLAREYDRLKAEHDAVRKRMKTAENQLKRLCEDAECVELPDGSSYTFKTDVNGTRRFLRRPAEEN